MKPYLRFAEKRKISLRKEIAQKSGGKGYGGSIGLPAESFKLFEIDVDFSFFVELVAVFGTEINKGNIVFQDVVDSDKHGMCYSNVRSLFTTAGANALKLGEKYELFTLTAE